MTGDEGSWLVMALIAVAGTIYVIYALVTGEVRGQRGVYSRADDPTTFWLGITTYAFLMGCLWYALARVVLNLGPHP